MRTIADGWFISFTRVACCSFSQPKNIPHHNMGRVQEETEGKTLSTGLLQFLKQQTKHTFLNSFFMLCLLSFNGMFGVHF